LGESVTWPTDPVRDLLVETVQDATVIGSPGLVLWDQIKPLGANSWRRFTLAAQTGNIDTLTNAPAIGAGGICYINRVYSLDVFYERGKNKQSPGADSDLMTDDAERIMGAFLRMPYNKQTTGIEKVEPTPWTISILPNGQGSVNMILRVLLRREL